MKSAARIAPALIAGILLMMAQVSEAQTTITRSSTDPARLKFIRDPHVPVFFPGNAGEFMFREKPENPMHQRWRAELLCDGFAADFASSSYDYHMTDADAESTSPPRYWKRMQWLLDSSLFYNQMVDLRVNAEFVKELDSASTSTDYLAQCLAQRCATSMIPLISFDVNTTGSAQQFFNSLRAKLPAAMLGQVLHQSATAAPGFDFYIFEADALKSANVHQLSAKVGDKPVLLHYAVPDFDAEILAMADGAAGFYNELPPQKQNQENADWKAFRSIAAFTERIPPAHFQRMPELAESGFSWVVGTKNLFYALKCKGTAETSCQIPTPAEKPEYVPAWYNPATDETIYLPRRAAPVDGKLNLRAPSDDSWIYTYLALPESTDRDTTTPVPVIDPDLIVPE
jgi:hypothetical protein